MTLKKRAAALAVGALVCAGSVVLMASSATASEPEGLLASGSAIRYCANEVDELCAVVDVTNYDAWVPISCWKDSTVGPSMRFFYIPGVGYAEAIDVSHQPSVPEC